MFRQWCNPLLNGFQGFVQFKGLLVTQGLFLTPHGITKPIFQTEIRVALWTKAGFVLETFAHPRIPSASAREYIVVGGVKVCYWQIKSQYKNRMYPFTPHEVLFFPLWIKIKSMTERDRGVCSTMESCAPSCISSMTQLNIEGVFLRRSKTCIQVHLYHRSYTMKS